MVYLLIRVERIEHLGKPHCLTCSTQAPVPKGKTLYNLISTELLCLPGFWQNKICFMDWPLFDLDICKLVLVEEQHIFNMINSYYPTKWQWVGRWGKFIEAVAVKDRVICYNSLSVYSLPPPSWKDRESNNMQSKIFKSGIITQNKKNV